MLKKILLGVVLFVILLLGYAALQPTDYKISRSLTINAPAEAIFPYVVSARKMDSWNPWLKLDPQTKMSYSGPEDGVGSKSSWESGRQLGTGSATIVEVTPNTYVKTKLEYLKPFAMTQVAEFSLKPEGAQTLVTWSVQGQNQLISKVFALFVNMEKMIGGTFETGLADLKKTVEH